MRFRPANIRVINRRDDRLGRRPHCFPLAREEQRKSKPRMYLTGSSISELEGGLVDQNETGGLKMLFVLNFSDVGLTYGCGHLRFDSTPADRPSLHSFFERAE